MVFRFTRGPLPQAGSRRKQAPWGEGYKAAGARHGSLVSPQPCTPLSSSSPLFYLLSLPPSQATRAQRVRRSRMRCQSRRPLSRMVRAHILLHRPIAHALLPIPHRLGQPLVEGHRALGIELDADADMHRRARHRRGRRDHRAWPPASIPLDH